ncbi:MAG: nucleoside kinase [Lachnospiraceae bacterium]|nr:nucleoside kinase [Lachnospiraceae bacterium]
MGKVTVNIEGEKAISFTEETTYRDIAKKACGDSYKDIVLAKVDGKFVELFKPVEDGAKVFFESTYEKNGRRTYRRSLIFLMERALMELNPKEDVRVMYSLGDGYFCKLKDDANATEEFVSCLKNTMMALVEKDLPITKNVEKTINAKEYFKEKGMTDKERLLRYRTSSNINIYDLDGCRDYFYGFMVPSTGYLHTFDLKKFEDGFMLLYPTKKDPYKIAPFDPAVKLFNTLKTSSEWGKTMEIGTVGALNDAIAAGKTREIILTQEALMEEQIGSLAKEIVGNPDTKFIMIAGPSSSGKTTFSHRLSTQLQARGLKPHPFPLDDYYLNRDQIPLDEFGEKDFEALEGLDIELFNSDMQKLLKGERTLLPTFNFKTGNREYHDRYMQLGKDDVLVIEGIHGLNDKLSYSLPKESKYKIYISALTQLSIDEHNPLSTTDGRLIRRIVRDARTRGTSAAGTIDMWDSVRRGEEKNIFPFQEGADAMFNSALIYEMAVLKTFCQPQLYAIEPGDKQYVEANRLLKLLDYVLPMPTEDIANNSLVREFIGGGCFGL